MTALRPPVAAGGDLCGPPARSAAAADPIRIATTAAFPEPASSIRTTTALACARRGASAQRPATGALPQPQQPAVGADGRPVQLAALPPEEQPEVGSCAACRRTCAARKSPSPTKEPAGTHRRRYAQHLSLLRARWRPRDPLRRPRRPRRLHLDRRAEDQPQGRVAGLASADRDDRAPALSAALHGRRPRQSARRARACISARPSIASTAPTSPRRSASSSRRAASAC